MDKPEFDPNIPFEATDVHSQDKPEFDPSLPFEKPREAPISIYRGLTSGGLDGVVSALRSQGDAASSLHSGAEISKAERDASEPTLTDKFLDPDRWKAILGYGPLSDKGVVSGSPELAIPAEAAPSALLQVVKALDKSAPLRVAANAAIGGARGGLQDPGENGSRIKNAAIGAGVGGTTAGLLELINSIYPYAASKLMGIKKADAVTYAENKGLANDIYNKFQEDPEALNQELSGMIKDSLYGDNSVFDKKSAPLLQKRGELLVGKNVDVVPSQFKGTAAEPELIRIQNLTRDPTEVGHYGQRADVPSAIEDRMTVTGAQAQRLKKMLQDAADYKESLNPIGYLAKNDAEAIAASKVRAALEGVEPRIGPLNEELGRNARMTEAAKKLFGSNPSRILNNSEAIGNTNIRSLQNYLDENAGTNFSDLADAFNAAKAVHNPSRLHGIWDRLVTDPIGRALLFGGAGASPYLKTPILPEMAIQLGIDKPADRQSAIDRRLGGKNK